jgi:hypothetical protein
VAGRNVAGVHRLRQPRTWFAFAVILGLLALFVVDGAPGGGVAAGSMVSFFVGAFLSLRGEPAEDRTAGTGMFGGY